MPSPIATVAVNLAVEIAKQIIKALLTPAERTKAWDATAERLAFDAAGQRKLEARRARK